MGTKEREAGIAASRQCRAAAGRAVEGGGGGLTSAAGAAAARARAGAGCRPGRVPAVMRRHLGYALRLTGPQLRGSTAEIARGGGGIAGTCPRPGWLLRGRCGRGPPAVPARSLPAGATAGGGRGQRCRSALEPRTRRAASRRLVKKLVQIWL